MLGLSFFVLMSKNLPEERFKFQNKIIQIKNPEVDLPDKYSSDLRNFIKSLMADYEKRPSSGDAYYKILREYMIKYMNVTSIFSFLLCFFALKQIKIFFQKDFQFYYPNLNNKKSKTVILKECFDIFSSKNAQFKELLTKCYILRYSLVVEKLGLDKSKEMDLFVLIDELFSYLVSELKYSNNSNNFLFPLYLNK